MPAGVYKRISLADRFWVKVKKGDPSECWLWVASKNTAGYGQLSNGQRGSTRLFAHRVSWQLHNGNIPKEICVLHRCDVPACVNPAHLFLGTKGDNNRDCRTKNRSPKGSAHSNSKISEEIVRAIREERKKTKCTQQSLASKYGVSRSNIGLILNNLTWSHV